MSAAPSWGRSATTLEAVWGPAWPLLLVLLGFPGLLSLLFAAATRHDMPMVHAVFGTLSVGSCALALFGSAWAVQRQARVQRIWASRLAPLAAGRRVARAVGQGLAMAWLVATVPMLLLGSSKGLGHNAIAGASLLAVMMVVVAAWGCAWQGRLAKRYLLPAALATALVLILGPSALWAHWLAVGWPAQIASLMAAAWGLPRVLAARNGSNSAVPALAWAGLQQRVARFWRRGYRRVAEKGEASPSPAVAAMLWYPITNELNLGPMDPSTGWAPVHQGVMGALTALIFLSLTYNTVLSTDLHWRQWLAPGAHRRQGLGLRVLGQSATAHSRVALCLIVLVTVAAALWPWGERANNLTKALETLAVVGLYWLLALPAAVWLRGLKAGAGRRLAYATGIVVVWLAISALLVWAGVEQRGTLLLCLVGLSGLALLPAIRSVWQHRDLADFMPRKTHSLEVDA